MERVTRLGAVVAVSAFAAAVAACSPAPSGGGLTGYGNGSSGGNSRAGGSGGSSGSSNSAGGGSSGGGSGAAASSGGQAPGASSSGGPSTGGGSGGSSGAGSSGSGGSGGAGSTSSSSGAGGSGTDGGSSTGRGCGQGTSCTPGNDLAPPAAGQGIQIATPPGAITVQPGQEAFLCYYKTLPNTATIDVGAFQSWMTPGSSHHFIAYQQGSGVIGSSGTQPDGTLVSCPFGGGTWMYATSLPGQVIEMKMPDGVGLPLPAGTQILLNMHFINPGTTAVTPVVKMNLIYAQNVQYKAAAMVSFNLGINVPAASTLGPGTQTVRGTCSAPAGSNFFVMTTHTHKHATATDVNFIHNGVTTNLAHTTDWEHPDVGVWNAPNFLTVQSGDSFTYSCAYSNTGTSAVTVGETAASNEMCMAIGYYFPAGNASCN